MQKVVFFISLFFIAACNKAPLLYKPDITQGNVFKPEQVGAILPGMPRAQVRHILGTPTITDPFHPEIDNYVFVYNSGSENRTYRRSLKIHYNQENLVINKTETPLSVKGN